MPVTTTVPALRMAENACATCSVLSTPTVTTAESAPWPLVTERANSAASSIVANAWVAPSDSAVSRLNSTGSTAITCVAPTCEAPCTALMPMPPMPMMMTVWPGLASAAFTTEPQPVPTPQPTRHAFSSGRSLSTFTHDATSTTVSSQNVEIPAPWPIGWPSMLIR